MMKPIFYGKHNVSKEDIDAVVDVLTSDSLTQGPRIKEFEDAFASYVNARYAVAVSNGTAALHLCALALDVSHGQKIITSPITFVASANCIRYCGGEVVFGDIDPRTYLLDIKSVRGLLEASPIGTYSGLVLIDFAGRAVDLESYKKIAREYNLWIIEDACHAPGGSFLKSNGKESKCGSGEFADLAIFSFHPVKHITSGEGGMITTNNRSLYERLLALRSHGIVKQTQSFLNSVAFANGDKNAEKYPLWYMEMQELGYNYRMTDFQAALGLSQLGRAKQGIVRRRKIASEYDRAFKNKPFIKGGTGLVIGHAYHLYVVEVIDRLGLYNYLRENQVYAQVHYIPCHLMPYYRQQGWKEGDLPHAENYYMSCISLPIYPTLTIEEQNFVIERIFSFYEG